MKEGEFINAVNRMATGRTPFVFIADFDRESFEAFPLHQALDEGVLFDVKGKRNYTQPAADFPGTFRFEMHPVPYSEYLSAFELVRQHILHGNSFLLNLTFPTPLETDLTLDQVFHYSMAPYRLKFRDDFTVFSPECFIRIEKDHIFSYPMKGTIDASLPDAELRLLQNRKEQWEHNTIVDLIRNDLSMVSSDVRVTKFRYIDRITTHRSTLLQVSSEIRGTLEQDWKARLGEIITTLLPAGSISGAPKQKTVEIIHRAEPVIRGYFTGIFGMFDGASLDSAVMIRFIEHANGGMRFRSGGGITGNSDPGEEYREMLEKVYVPIVRNHTNR